MRNLENEIESTSTQRVFSPSKLPRLRKINFEDLEAIREIVTRPIQTEEK